MILPAVICALVIGLTLIYASFLDHRDRRVAHRIWKPALIIALPLAAYTYIFEVQPLGPHILAACLACSLLYLLHTFKFFGGADAYALMIITVCLPLHPWTPIGAQVWFPTTVMLNALLLCVAVPVLIFLKKDKLPGTYPVPFMIPITAGFFTALFYGDIFTGILSLLL